MDAARLLGRQTGTGTCGASPHFLAALLPENLAVDTTASSQCTHEGHSEGGWPL